MQRQSRSVKSCINSALVDDAVNAIQYLAMFNSVQLIWVPGHRGIDATSVLTNLHGLHQLRIHWT